MLHMLDGLGTKGQAMIYRIESSRRRRGYCSLLSGEALVLVFVIVI